jgi:fructose-1,6-bisphosphatase/sedoheptulose 1,7-bisphosphatase-like protein
MRFTAEDIRRQIEQSTPGTGISQSADLGIQNLLSSMAIAAQNSLLEGCPIFIDRLRANPKLAQHIKEMMQNWGKQEE